MKKLLSKISIILGFTSLLPSNFQAIYRNKDYLNTRMKTSCSLCNKFNFPINEKDYDKLMDKVIDDIILEVLHNWKYVKQGGLDENAWKTTMIDLTRQRLMSKDDLLDGYSFIECKKISDFLRSNEKLLEYFRKFLSRSKGIGKYKACKFVKIIEIWERAPVIKELGKEYKSIKMTHKDHNDTLLDKDEIIELIKIFVKMCKEKIQGKSKIKTPDSLIAKKLCEEYLINLPQFKDVNFNEYIKKIYPNYEDKLHLHYWWKILHDDVEKIGVRGVCRHRAPWLAYKISKTLGGNVAIFTCKDSDEKSKGKYDPKKLNHECTLVQLETKDKRIKWFVADPQRLTDLALGVVGSCLISFGKLPDVKQCKKYMNEHANECNLGKIANNGALGLLKCPFKKFINSNQLFSGYMRLFSSRLTPNLDNYSDFVDDNRAKKVNDYLTILSDRKMRLS